MKFQNRPGILTQAHVLFSLALAGCATVSLQAVLPTAPSTLADARQYMATREQQLEFLEYELNQQTRACYEKFFISACVDAVRERGTAYRRAHLEIQDQASEMIRLDAYAKRQSKKKDSSN